MEQISQYLTAELEAINARAVAAEQNAASKVNFYLLIVTAAVGGIILLISNEKLVAYLSIIAVAACVLLAFLVLVGWSTFLQVIDLAASATFFYRRAGRIRRWFLDLEPAVLPYLPFKPGDDNPTFLAPRSSLRGIETVLLLVNSAMLGIALGLGTGLALHQSGRLFPLSTLLIGILVGFVMFVVSWILHVGKVKRYLASREREQHEKQMILFPAAEYEKQIDAWRAARATKTPDDQPVTATPDPAITKPAAKTPGIKTTVQRTK